jgi:citrate lyase subunit beta/citryl-CoA lyase
MITKDTLMRSCLYVSGANPINMIEAVFYNEDCIVYDLEDSVPITEKDAARILVYHALHKHRPSDKVTLIRVNGLHTGLLDEDLEAAIRAQPDALRVPKLESAAEVQQISAKMAAIESRAGIAVGSIGLCCNIESYLGLLHASDIAKADPRVFALALGAEDLTVSLKARRTRQGIEILYARNVILVACRSAGIRALDSVFSDINDLEGLGEDTALARNLGFDGKSVIHPRQIDIVNAFFTPDKAEIEYALRVLAAVQEGQRLNKGAVSLEGKMIDRPIELRALNTLNQARAAGIKIGEAHNAG